MRIFMIHRAFLFVSCLSAILANAADGNKNIPFSAFKNYQYDPVTNTSTGNFPNAPWHTANRPAQKASIKRMCTCGVGERGDFSLHKLNCQLPWVFGDDIDG
jgi:hypothetical protein